MDRSVAGEQNTIFIPEKEDMAIQTKYAPFLPPSFPAVFPTFLFFNKQTNKHQVILPTNICELALGSQSDSQAFSILMVPASIDNGAAYFFCSSY